MNCFTFVYDVALSPSQNKSLFPFLYNNMFVVQTNVEKQIKTEPTEIMCWKPNGYVNSSYRFMYFHNNYLIL